MNTKLQQLKVKTKINFSQNMSKCCHGINYRKQSGYFQFEEDAFDENSQRIAKIFHEVNVLSKLLQTYPQSKSMNINYYDF